MKAGRLICAVGGHTWKRFRREGVDMRECQRCGYLVRRDADPLRMLGADGGLWTFDAVAERHHGSGR